jgi:hypothetical protein
MDGFAGEADRSEKPPGRNACRRYVGFFRGMWSERRALGWRRTKKIVFILTFFFRVAFIVGGERGQEHNPSSAQLEGTYAVGTEVLFDV